MLVIPIALVFRRSAPLAGNRFVHLTTCIRHFLQDGNAKLALLAHDHQVSQTELTFERGEFTLEPMT